MPYLIYDKPGEPSVYMVTPQELAGDLTGVEAGTLSLVRKGDGVHTTDSTAQSIVIEAQGE